jgi:3-hydroxyacyl-[acyl-carrier-protein] dehydratase
MSEQAIPLPIAADHPAYAGHFPGRPILPGVVLLDAALQALAARQGVQATTGQIKSAKFLSPVRPGETLILHATESSPGSFRIEIRCFDANGDERGAASGSLVFSRGAAA